MINKDSRLLNRVAAVIEQMESRHSEHAIATAVLDEINAATQEMPQVPPDHDYEWHKVVVSKVDDLQSAVSAIGQLLAGMPHLARGFSVGTSVSRQAVEVSFGVRVNPPVITDVLVRNMAEDLVAFRVSADRIRSALTRALETQKEH